MNAHVSTPATKANPYTPTHTADGRKLTRAERKAANKAKWAAEQAARKADAPKPKGKRKGKQAPKPAPAPAPTPAPKQAPMKVADIKAWMEANPRRKQVSAQEIADFTPAPAPAEGEGEGEPAPAPKRKSAKAKAIAKAEYESEREARAEERRQERKERKENWLESKAQRQSMRKQADRRAKEREGTTQVVCVDNVEMRDGRIVSFDVVPAEPFRPRMEVPVNKPERKRKPLPTIPKEFLEMDPQRFNYFSRAGLIPTDEVTLDDCI